MQAVAHQINYEQLINHIHNKIIETEHLKTKLSPQLTELYNNKYEYQIYQEDIEEYSTAKLIQRLRYQGIEINV